MPLWAGDKEAEGVLKTLVTEKYIMIEYKGKDSLRFRNCMRLIMSSNKEWIAPVESGNRRFFLANHTRGAALRV